MVRQAGSIPVYSGAPYQRGYGLGHVLKNVMISATPLLKQAGKEAFKRGASVIASGIFGSKPQPRCKKARAVKRTVAVNKKVKQRHQIKLHTKREPATWHFRVINRQGSFSFHQLVLRLSERTQHGFCSSGKSEVDLFGIPLTQTAIESSQWVEHRPITTLSDSAAVDLLSLDRVRNM